MEIFDKKCITSISSRQSSHFGNLGEFFLENTAPFQPELENIFVAQFWFLHRRWSWQICKHRTSLRVVTNTDTCKREVSNDENNISRTSCSVIRRNKNIIFSQLKIVSIWWEIWKIKKTNLFILILLKRKWMYSKLKMFSIVTSLDYYFMWVSTKKKHDTFHVYSSQ